MAVLLMCIPQGKVCAMLCVISVEKQLTSQREETLMCFQSSASYVKKINILIIHIPRRDSGEKLSVCEYTSGELDVN